VIESAVDAVLADGARTADIAQDQAPISTSEFVDAVIAKITA
jgi:isocitrate dehydrogenase